MKNFLGIKAKIRASENACAESLEYNGKDCVLLYVLAKEHSAAVCAIRKGKEIVSVRFPLCDVVFNDERLSDVLPLDIDEESEEESKDEETGV